MNKLTKQVTTSAILILVSIYIWSYIMHLPQYDWQAWYGMPTMITALFTTIGAYIFPIAWEE